MVPDIFRHLEINAKDKHTAITRQEGEAIFNFLKEKKTRKTLEIGLAYGVSTAYIMSATGSIHYAIDPFQHSQKYRGLGIKNIGRLKLKNKLKFIEDFSHAALPGLLKKNQTFNFILIDGGHNFDTVFVDFYFCDLLLEQKGYILLHDTWLLSIQTVAEWIKQNKKNYRVVDFPAKNCLLLQKDGDDKRKWYHFKSFAVRKREMVKKLLDYVLK